MILLIVLYVIIGLIMIGLSIPLIQGKVKPNRWYGFRIKLTLENPDIWYPANTYAGKLLLICGIIVLVASLLFSQIPGITEDSYAIWVSVAMLGSLFITLYLAVKRAKALAKANSIPQDEG